MSFFFFTKVRRKRRRTNVSTKKGLLEHGEKIRIVVHEKLVFWNAFYGFSYNRVFIRAQSTRWGSCSSKKNLNFNYRLIHLPESLVDYIIVHELCHLGEFNHSKKFWDLVAKTIPDFEKRRAELRKIEMK